MFTFNAANHPIISTGLSFPLPFDDGTAVIWRAERRGAAVFEVVLTVSALVPEREVNCV